MTDEGTAGRSQERKMLARAKHMGLLENTRAVKDRLFQNVETNKLHNLVRKKQTKKHLPNRQPLHKPKNGRQYKTGSLGSYLFRHGQLRFLTQGLLEVAKYSLVTPHRREKKRVN